MTRTDFGPRPELEKITTAKRARTLDGRVKRLPTLTKGRTPGEASGSQRPIVKQGIKELELVNAVKEGRSITNRPFRSELLWEYYIKRYELNLDDHIYIVSDKTSLDSFIIKCLKRLDAEKKMAILERV